MYLIESILDKIENEMARMYWNRHQQEMPASPFRNSGGKYENNIFSVRAYDWDGNYEPNFEYKELKVWWYKNSHRALSWEYNHEKNVLPPSYFLEDMLYDCITSVVNDTKFDIDT